MRRTNLSRFVRRISYGGTERHAPPSQARPVTQPDARPPSETPRRPLRPLHGIPDRDRRGPQGLLLSTLLHLAILIALLLPPLVARELDRPLTTGGGGAGPAGGGGGGTGGTGGDTVRPERLRYLRVSPPPPTPKAPDQVVPPMPVPIPKPEEKVVTPPEPTAVVTAPEASGTTIPTTGVGGGSGNDGTAGNGPGRGGGVGSGVGTGRGSGNGPGTGGGPGDIYPAQVTNLALLPIPVPSKVRPYKMIAWFDVDERGNAKLISFNPSRDGNYNKKLRDMLAEMRFRPAVRADGTPVRDTVSVTAEAPL